MKKIIAHRGAPYLAHENTIESFCMAIESGADIIEFDVRRTKDNILIAHHDPFVLYECKKLNISELTYTELQTMSSFLKYQVPKIESIFKLLHMKTGFDIELKEEGCEEEILEMLSELPVSPEYFFTSFNSQILRKLKCIDTNIKTGFLFDNNRLISEINPKIADYLCPEYSIYLQNRDYFSSQFMKDYSIAVWTINTFEDLMKAITDPLVKAIITNDTMLTFKILNNISPQVSFYAE